ncbi:MAG TPA: glycosyltransferase family 2 protein [Vicinamibacterales bacterium]|nr:glycosyltransferase family 2 protein [Vicinamibacterales bacterium]
MPRVIIGSPLYNHANDFREAIESILGQTYADFALVLVDDCSTDATPEIAREYAGLDPRVTYLVNPQRLGLVDNARRAFAVACERHPEAEYFAWASDHDLWHPRWLQALVEALDRYPEVVLAYPLNRRIGPSGELLARKPWSFDTLGITDSWKRLNLSIVKMSAGNMVYGLYRIPLLARAGVYRRVLVPDRLLMTELAVYGQFKQVPEVLWFRRWYGRIFSLGRQRKTFFPEGRPLYMYAPWWVSHGVSLFWTFGVQKRGMPAVTGAAGAILGLKYLVFSGLFHAWQTLRAWRIGLLERLGAIRPYERRLRLVTREVVRRGVVDWTSSHTKHYVGAKARRRAMSRVKKGVKRAAFQSVRRPGLALLRRLREIPLVRSRVVPSLLRQELDQIPAAPIVAALERELDRVGKSSAPILVGPWVSEVGFELLYWIPFLTWAVKAFGLQDRRMVVVSRGGARLWYQHLTTEYVDVFDLMTVEEYRAYSEERWSDKGHQKQFDVTDVERRILGLTRTRLGLGETQLLHPSLMYKLLRYYWYEKAPAGLLTKHTEYRRLPAVERGDALKDLPSDYVAVRFYFRPSFPDTPENRRFAAGVIRALSRDVPVVLLNTGLDLDDHEDLQVPGGMGVHTVERLMTPQGNLEMQTRIVANARAFVGTYGGLAYLGPLYGVPSVGFYSHESELVPAHLDVGWRLGKVTGAPLSTIDVKGAGMLRLLFGAGELDWAGGSRQRTAGGSAVGRL